MFFTLLKARLAYMFSGTVNRAKKNKPAGIGMVVLISLLFLYLAAAFFGISFAVFLSVCRALCDNGSTDVYFAIAALMSFLLGFVGSVMAAKTQVFESKDNDLLLSMPISHEAIILSRLAALLVVEYAMQLLVALPCAIVYTMFYGFSMSVALLLVLGFLLLPLMTLTASCLVGWLISLITSRLGRLKTVVSILLYVVFFSGYMFIYMNVFSSDIDGAFDNIARVLEPIVDGLRTFAPPMIWFGRGVAGSALYFLLFAASAIVPALIMLWIMSRTFVSTAARGQRTASAKRVSGDSKAHSIPVTLLNKELSHVFSSAGYLLNSTSGALITVIAAVFAAVKADTLSELMALDPIITRFAPTAVAAIAVMLASMNTMSATLISIEGRSLWILQSLPIRGADVLISKLLAHIVVCAVPSVASLIAVGVIVGIDPLHTLLIILLSVSATVLFAAFGLVINLMMPRFDWANEMAAAKQGGSTIVSVLCSMLIALIISAAAALPTLFLDCGVGMIISTIICLGASALLCLYLVRSGGKRFECLQSDS